MAALKNVVIERVNGMFAKKAKKPLAAIRMFCCECMGMSRTVPTLVIPQEDIKGCTDLMCPLYEWRFGKNAYPSKAKAEMARERFLKHHRTAQKRVKDQRSHLDS
jgi:hypothetical protein